MPPQQNKKGSEVADSFAKAAGEIWAKDSHHRYEETEIMPMDRMQIMPFQSLAHIE